MPYFHGANYFTILQWILATMANLGVWADKQILQVQGLAYTHCWEKPSSSPKGRDFLLVPKVKKMTQSLLILSITQASSLAVLYWCTG
eukprot:11817965-Ditylum_brightwellii.AAC.2